MQIRDPLLGQIEAALDQPLDGNQFEAAMCSMLRHQGIYPTLVPVRGGNDAGMDGAIGDPAGGGPPIPLVCTTQENLKANLEKSLKSYLKNGGAAQRIVFATSRKLTPPVRRKLEVTAGELGFTVLNIYERAAVTTRAATTAIRHWRHMEDRGRLLAGCKARRAKLAWRG